MAELIKNPESMIKVQLELAREIKQDVVKEFHLPQLNYLQASVKETLRLHPPAPLLLPHHAIESYQVTSYTIPKDSQVLVNVWAIGQDPMYWEDPSVFKPERFLNSALDFKGNDFEFLPFSAGRRICPGLPMATKVVPLVLASLIHNFDWSLPHGYVMCPSWFNRMVVYSRRLISKNGERERIFWFNSLLPLIHHDST